jgi:hypothetical protein
MSSEAGPSTVIAPAPEKEIDNNEQESMTSLQETGIEANGATTKYARGENPKLRYRKPYWWPYKTFVKQR